MSEPAEEFLRALRRVVEELGATVVTIRSSRAGDLPVEWHGETIAYIRRPELHGALGRLVGAVESEVGCALADMTREQKQIAVRRLDEHGAFLLRGAVEDVAQIMGVSKVTLYSYINALAGSRQN